jgi:hypothetical protein
MVVKAILFFVKGSLSRLLLIVVTNKVKLFDFHLWAAIYLKQPLGEASESLRVFCFRRRDPLNLIRSIPA